jgi:hypothetical protein
VSLSRLARMVWSEEPPASAVAAVIEKLTAALALWRGAAAGDGLPRGTILDNRFASLDEQRLQVFEELAQARLALLVTVPRVPVHPLTSWRIDPVAA